MKKYTILLLGVVCLRTAVANTFTVPVGGDLQAALNQAQPGDTVLLTPGATYTGHFTLAPNPGPQWITIQSAALASLPAAGTRVAPANAPLMPKLITPDGSPALAINTGANYYRLQGLEFGVAPGVYVQDLIRIGTGGESSNAQLPHDLDFDRDYIHGDPTAGGKRGIALNGGATTVENSYVSTFISTGQDTQAICGWNGPGPYTIANNYLEAGSEIVAFGGANVAIPYNTPSDIVIKNNTFFKPLSWRPGDPSYAGFPVWAKNHIELKNAQRVTIDSNTFTNNWIGADQQGFTLVFSVRTEGGAVPWAVVNNITVTNNIVRHSAAGALFVGHDGTGGSSGTFKVQNNLWEDISGAWGGDGRLFEILNGVNGISFDHNTAFQTGWPAVFDVGTSININFTNNIFNLGAGIAGDGTANGTPTLLAYAGGGIFTNNVLIGTTNNQYPANTFFPASIDQVGFVNYNAENFLLAANSPYKGMATDGSDLGSSVLPSGASTTPTPTPTPTPVIPTGWVNIIAKHSGKCLDITGASTAPGTAAIQYTCWGGDNQKFQLTSVSGGYSITAKHSGLALEILGGPAVTWGGATVDQWYYWGGTSQIWQVVPTADGYYNLKPTNDGLCMAVAAALQTNVAPVIQWSCYGGNEQKWSLIPAQ
jgi:hypothetical protein